MDTVNINQTQNKTGLKNEKKDQQNISQNKTYIEEKWKQEQEWSRYLGFSDYVTHT